MSQTISTIDRAPLNETFRSWRGEQKVLSEQIAGSVAALADYRAQLDLWHQALESERDQLDVDHGDARQQDAEANRLRAELSEARQQIAQITGNLLTKTEELRELDNARAKLEAELEILRTRAAENSSPEKAADDRYSQQQSEWMQELKQVRAMLQDKENLRQTVPIDAPDPVDRAIEALEDPVLGSVVAQFDKLRQQQLTRTSF